MFRRLDGAVPDVTLIVDGQPVQALRGETVANALLCAGITTLRRSSVGGKPRATYCGMGVCFDCLLTIDGQPNRQSCLVRAEPGMTVSTGLGRPDLVGAKQ